MRNPAIVMKRFTLLLLIIPQLVFSQQFKWQNIEPKTDASFRGLSVVDDSVAWVSGSKGWVGRSSNGGKEWQFSQVKGYEKCDFRSVYAFNAQTAIIANAGSPAFILRTTNGGKNWRQVYKNEDTSAFIDGIDFFNDSAGIVYGDPLSGIDRGVSLKGKLMLLNTIDYGGLWSGVPGYYCPDISEGEASFAASGTTIRCYKHKAIIATGGKKSRLLVNTIKEKDMDFGWMPIETPIIQGRPGTGIFSFDFINDKTGIIVGGDYKIDSLKENHIFLTKDGGQTWKAPKIPTRGYRECVAYITKKIVIASGPTGTDVSYNGGRNWYPLSDEKGFHVIRKSRKGSLIIIAGSMGKISLLH